MAYKTTCKECQSNNFYVTPENGVGYCFSCGYLERDNESRAPRIRYHDVFAIRQLYGKLANYYHSCLDTPHVRYLESRGITSQDITAYQIGYCPDERHVLYAGELAMHAGVSTHDGFAWLRNRLVWPYGYRGVITDLRGRAMVPDEKKYLSLRGDGYFRGADYPYCADDMATSDTLVLTEGEIKAIFSRRAGFATIGLPGIQSLKPEIVKDKTYIVCFDSQAHMSDVYRAIHRIGTILPHVRVATLPLNGADKQDIDSYIMAYRIEAYQRVIRRALPFAEWRALVRY